MLGCLCCVPVAAWLTYKPKARFISPFGAVFRHRNFLWITHKSFYSVKKRALYGYNVYLYIHCNVSVNIYKHSYCEMEMRLGTVKSYDTRLKVGVIKQDGEGPEAQFTQEQLYNSGVGSLFSGDRVEYELWDVPESLDYRACCIKKLSGSVSVRVSQ